MDDENTAVEPTDAIRATERRYPACPRCGMPVYRTRRETHDRECAIIVARFGGPRQLARLFWDYPALCLDDLVEQLPDADAELLRRMAIAGGIPAHELAARQEDREAERRGEMTARAARRHRCRRCFILLDGRGVPPGREPGSGFCGWCDGSVPAVSPTGPQPPERPMKALKLKSWRA